jgi:hypothetical protein
MMRGFVVYHHGPKCRCNICMKLKLHAAISFFKRRWVRDLLFDVLVVGFLVAIIILLRLFQ